ncbi:GyrI-like domain-containing protein [Paenibacillus koleovorans]|uniref:GyrI-like domain-containing protein n=1 Tax=Paenibacillus koleovorans TaxID=121608 RepID=UPI000FDBF1A0|nr:GyrI-like domain-containing protein [Paenibacillus koleovorans]
MSEYRVEQKESFRLVGFKTMLTGSTEIHSPAFTGQKTAFFKTVIQDGQMALLRPLAESPYGYGAIAVEGNTVSYYAGVVTNRQAEEGLGADELLFPGGDYLVLEGAGGLSRLAFDKLEDQAFGEMLRESDEWAYAGGPVAEVLLNGNPTDAQVEVWVPVRKRG